MENKLSPSERMILDYIKYRTNNKRKFFGSNKHIADYIGIKTTSVKVLLSGLIKAGYVERVDDGTHQRLLKLTGKEYLSMTGCNMSDLDKGGLKRERDEYRKEYEHMAKWNDELQAEYNQLKQKYDALERNFNELNTQLIQKFIPDYQAKIDRIKELEGLLSSLKD